MNGDSFFDRVREVRAGASGLDVDDVDDRLIAALAADPRASFAALGKQVGLSRSNARQRLLRLFDSGILAVNGRFDPRIAGIGVVELVGIRTEGDGHELADAVAQIDEAVFVVETAGMCDVLVELHCRDAGHLAATVHRLRTLPGIAGVDSWSIVEAVKQRWDSVSVPAGEATTSAGTTIPELDEHDRALAAALEWNGRASFTDLAHEVGLSLNATRARVRRLLDTHAVTLQVVPGVAAIEAITYLGGFMTVQGPLQPALDEAAGCPEVNVVAVLTGRHHVGIEAWVADLAHLRELLERLRRLPGVTSLESLFYLRGARYYHQLGSRRVRDPDAGRSSPSS